MAVVLLSLYVSSVHTSCISFFLFFAPSFILGAFWCNRHKTVVCSNTDATSTTVKKSIISEAEAGSATSSFIWKISFPHTIAQLIFPLFVFSTSTKWRTFKNLSCLLFSREVPFVENDGEKNWQMETYLDTKYTLRHLFNIIDQCHPYFAWASASQHTHPQLLYSVHLWLPTQGC